MQKFGSLIAFFLLALTASNLRAAQPIIKVTAATWSGQNVLAPAAKFCDGKNTCTYKISSQYVGEASDSNNKSFSIAWICDNAPKAPQKLHRAHDATDKVIELKCPTPASHSLTKTSLPNNLQDPLFPLKSPVSFHSMLMAEGINSVQKVLSEKCLSAIRNHLTQRKNFSSKIMRDRFTIELKNYPFPEVRDGVFWHYTKAPQVPKIAREKRYAEFFSFVRNNEILNFNAFFLYVAADDTSSSDFGPFKMKLEFSPTTLILQNGGDMPGDSMSHPQVNNLIEDELISKNSALSACRGSYTTEEPWTNNVLIHLAAEANGIGLIAYYGIGNTLNSSPLAAHGVQWLQVVGPWAIKNMEEVK